MNEQKSLLTRLGETLDQYRAERRRTAQERMPSGRAGWLHRLLPPPGNVIFTLVMIALLVAAQSVGAIPLRNTQYAVPSSTATIAYQGRLANAAGEPLNGTYNMIFRLYTVATGGTPLWTEQWTGSNSVRVSDGLFNVMLGSLNRIEQNMIAGHDQLWLGITVGTDDEMQPRVQLGSVPFAVQALTVPDGSVTTAKIADGAVIGTKIANGAITQVHAPRLLASPAASNVKVFFGRESITADASTGLLSKTVFLPAPCTKDEPVKVWIQPDWHWHASVIATVGLPWDKTKFTVFLTGPTWSPGQQQEFDWIAVCD